MRTALAGWSCAVLALAGCLPANGQQPPGAPAQPPAQKSAYNLFHPAPDRDLREIGTDRADQTESPITLDAGHFQLEMDFCSFTLDRQNSGGVNRTDSLWSFAPFNLKIGLLNRADLELEIESHQIHRTVDHNTGERTRASGMGDMRTLLKLNVWGNDGGRTAFGVVPFVKWPLPESALRNGATEGGVILPFALDLGRGWDVGATTEADFVARDAGGRATAWADSISFGRQVRRGMRAYAEFATASAPEAHARWQRQVDAGATVIVRKNLMLAFGCNFGVSRSAPDFAPYAGLSFRL
jgi:hypothetical protein